MEAWTVLMRRRAVAKVMAGGMVVAAALACGVGFTRPAAPSGPYVCIAHNDLGMHCMQNDFSQMMILPPFNTLRAQVIHRGVEPDLLNESDFRLSYELPNNSTSADKTNFWQYAPALMGLNPAPDVGIFGKPMRGDMDRDAARFDWKAEGVPVTPIADDGHEDPYPLATVTVRNGSGTVIARTQAVVPVSWEMSCQLCHVPEAGHTVADNILAAHDRLHGTSLVASQPVMCASCHSDNALGTGGTPGVPSLSAAMHGAHAPRMAAIHLDNNCYACHPGVRTTCQRDVHAARGISCTQCHGEMAAVASPTRRPWLDEPSCGQCHQSRRPSFDFEPAGTLFRNAVGHGGVACSTCHGSPHAVGPATTAKDNAQAVRLQNMDGVIRDCLVCHTQQPGESFFHSVEH